VEHLFIFRLLALVLLQLCLVVLVPCKGLHRLLLLLPLPLPLLLVELAMLAEGRKSFVAMAVLPGQRLANVLKRASQGEKKLREGTTALPASTEAVECGPACQGCCMQSRAHRALFMGVVGAVVAGGAAVVVSAEAGKGARAIELNISHISRNGYDCAQGSKVVNY
jgi:hypothetical protein